MLLVEDDRGVRAFAEEALQSLGYKTESAASGDEMVQRLTRTKIKPSLLLTDIVMPGMTGHELAGYVAKLFPEIQILYTSGYTDDHIARQGLLESNIAFIQKPYSVNALSQKIEALLH